LTLSFEPGDRFMAAVDEWGDERMTDAESAMETKAEQALLEVEHLVSGADEVEFEVEGTTVRHHPTDDLREFLDDQAAETGLDPEQVLKLHVDLYARVFLDGDTAGPPGGPMGGPAGGPPDGPPT